MNRFLHQAVSMWAILGGIILLAIMVVTTLNAGAFAIDRIARYFGNTFAALPGYEDFVRLAVSSAALMFFPYCQYKRGHVVVDLFVTRFSPNLNRALDLFSLFSTTALALFLAYWMMQGMIETYHDNALSRVLGWHEWPFYLPGVISLILWAMTSGSQIFMTKDATARA